MLDAMTVYKDRRQYPHKLQSAIDAYGVTTQNTHRAVDDAKAALEVLDAMAREEDDLLRYVNLFGYNPKYGVSGPRISSITYLPHGSRARSSITRRPRPCCKARPSAVKDQTARHGASHAGPCIFGVS